MPDTTKREIIALIWEDVQVGTNPTPRNLSACKNAADLYARLRSQDIHPIVIVGPEEGIRASSGDQELSSHYLITYLDRAGLIPIDHILRPATGAYAGESGAQTAHRHQRSRSREGMTMAVHFVRHNL